MTSPPRAKRKRMSAADRAQTIINQAIPLFAEEGFEAGTTLLAERVGVTQGLLYKHFKSKEELIRSLFQTLYKPEWMEGWHQIFLNQKLPLKTRLCAFYVDYSEKMFQRNYLRLFMRGRLSTPPYVTAHYDIVRKEIFPIVIKSLREEFAPAHIDAPISPAEIEFVQMLHGSLYYVASRRWVHIPGQKLSLAPIVEMNVVAFLHAARAMWPAMFAKNAAGDWPKFAAPKGASSNGS